MDTQLKTCEVYNDKVKTNSRVKPFVAQFADRRDVVYKNLIRSLRRYLWEQFEAENHPETMS